MTVVQWTTRLDCFQFMKFEIWSKCRKTSSICRNMSPTGTQDINTVISVYSRGTECSVIFCIVHERIAWMDMSNSFSFLLDSIFYMYVVPFSIQLVPRIIETTAIPKPEIQNKTTCCIRTCYDIMSRQITITASTHEMKHSFSKRT